MKSETIHLPTESPVGRRFLGLVVKVGCTVGMSPKDAYDDMNALAVRMNCFIESDFNGFRIYTFPGQDYAQFFMDYEREKRK